MNKDARAALRTLLVKMGRAVSLERYLPRSKYMPHQGKREIARRLRKAA